MSATLRQIRRQVGLTLVELMVSLVLALVLMAGVIQLFAANKVSSRLTEAVSAMQENARFAMTRLEQDIRMAGFLGCTGRDRDAVAINVELNHGTAFTPENGIEGWEANGTGYGAYTLLAADAPVADASGTGWTSGGGSPVLDGGTDALATSDVIRLWQVDGEGVLVDVVGTSVDADVEPPYAAGDTVMLTDCASVDIVEVCALSNNDATLSGCSNASPSTLLNETGTAHAFKLAGWVYFVGKREDDPSNPPSLFRREISAGATADDPQELVEGVEALQVQYGEDTDVEADGVANAYVDADDVVDWTRVVSARIHLLMQSRRDDLVDGGQTLAFNGRTFTASDGRLRYPFMATVSVRNRSR
jgi:type IV pilus assembly protein PilW